MRRPWAAPLVPLYWLASAVKNGLYAERWLAPKRLRCPVISVGSLSAGGAGKTPVVLALAEVLGGHWFTVDVLSRGYGRESAEVLEVDPAGSAAEFGDEPLELARTGLQVFVGAERFAAGMLAEASGALPGRHVHLLDDGFQHRRLARQWDVVVLTLADLRDALLPGGNLREPLSSLRRADAIVVREEEAEEIYPVSSRLSHAKHWVVRRRLRLPADLPARPLAFCGLARPESFFATLRQAGVVTAGTRAFSDHHDYTFEDCDLLVRLAGEAGADGFVTTAKDEVKFTPELRARLEQHGRLEATALEVSFVDEAQVMRQLRPVLPGT